MATEGPKESAVQKDTSDVVSSALTLVPAEGELLFLKFIKDDSCSKWLFF